MEQLKATETIVDNSLRETKKHGTDGFPFAVYLDDFSSFRNGYICWHWHDEVQITLIIEGEFTCQIGNERVVMEPGESIFINSCALHQIRPCRQSYGRLYSFIWRADMLSGGDGDMHHSCIENILEGEQKYIFWGKDNANCRQIRSALLKIAGFITEKPDFFHLKIYNQLSKIWLDVCEYSALKSPQPALDYISRAKDEERVKNALQYMQAEYGENISLDDIARAAMTSRSELCKSFRRALDTSPKEFLMQYRIRQSIVLLENPGLRIADIAEMTGFSSPSHYGACFQKYVGCTPLQYRKNL